MVLAHPDAEELGGGRLVLSPSSHGQVHAGFPTLCLLALQCRKTQFAEGTEAQDSVCDMAQVDPGLLAFMAQYPSENFGENSSLHSL